MSASFVHLSVHSDHSLVDGTLQVGFGQGRREAGMLAVALTEQGNLFSLVKFYRAAIDAGGRRLLALMCCSVVTRTKTRNA